jgi:hypothetical protein
MAKLDNSAVINESFERLWEELAEEITKTRLLEQQAKERGTPDNDLLVRQRWLWLFEDELGGVQKVHNAIHRGRRVSERDTLVADEVAKRLLRLLRQGLDRRSEQSKTSIPVAPDALSTAPALGSG